MAAIATWMLYFVLLAATAAFGYYAVSEFDAVLQPWYERGSWLVVAGRAVVLLGWLFYFAKLGSDGVLPGVLLALGSGAYAKLDA